MKHLIKLTSNQVRRALDNYVREIEEEDFPLVKIETLKRCLMVFEAEGYDVKDYRKKYDEYLIHNKVPVELVKNLGKVK